VQNPNSKASVFQSQRSSMSQKKHISPVNTIRNFDLSYITNRMTARWPDADHMTNDELKQAFNNLLNQARNTEHRMRELIENREDTDEKINDSTDENCIKSGVLTDYINIGIYFPFNF
jgi:lipopolysaccharide biosynthesis glycosyltransferase